MYARLSGSLTLGLTAADVGPTTTLCTWTADGQCSGLEKTAMHAEETSSWRCCSMLQA